MNRRYITSAYIRSIIDKAETDLDGCLSILNPAHADKADEILSFQPRLLRSLLAAEAVYREIAQERNALIGRKSDFTEVWFRRRMAKLDQYRKCLKIVLGAGRTIGDGFAWIFYRHEPELIAQHLKLQPQPLLPPGLGGMGERVFLDKFQTMAGNLAVYHGTTSILRLGDFSFYDPIRRRITGIGELKTANEGNDTVQLQMRLVAQYSSSLVSGAGPDENSSTVPRAVFSQFHNERLARQINQIVSAFKETERSPGGKNIFLDKEIDLSKLRSVLDLSPFDHVKYEVIGKGLLLVAVASPGSIFEREIGRRAAKWKSNLDSLESEALKIINPGACDNAIIISSIGFSDEQQPMFMPGTTPICWWPLTQRQKSDLIFGRVMLFSIHNPSHFFDVFRKRGYSIDVDTNGKLKSATKRLSDRRTIMLENFSFFQNWATHYMFDEEALDNMIGTLEVEAQKSSVEGSLRIELNPQLLM